MIIYKKHKFKRNRKIQEKKTIMKINLRLIH